MHFNLEATKLKNFQELKTSLEVFDFFIYGIRELSKGLKILTTKQGLTAEITIFEKY